MTGRDKLIRGFLSSAGWGDVPRRPLAGDASFRRYDRLESSGRRAVLMDAPPPHEDVRPFLAVARLLRKLELSAPEILAEDV
ncbi:MAG TPA: phosphotransferase, partial [Stellaceae bacterium]|nr:phosphotransferase [Stellaceae bacterium]